LEDSKNIPTFEFGIEIRNNEDTAGNLAFRILKNKTLLKTLRQKKELKPKNFFELNMAAQRS